MRVFGNVQNSPKYFKYSFNAWFEGSLIFYDVFGVVRVLIAIFTIYIHTHTFTNFSTLTSICLVRRWNIKDKWIKGRVWEKWTKRKWNKSANIFHVCSWLFESPSGSFIPASIQEQAKKEGDDYYQIYLKDCYTTSVHLFTQLNYFEMVKIFRDCFRTFTKWLHSIFWIRFTCQKSTSRRRKAISINRIQTTTACGENMILPAASNRWNHSSRVALRLHIGSSAPVEEKRKVVGGA